MLPFFIFKCFHSTWPLGWMKLRVCLFDSLFGHYQRIFFSCRFLALINFSPNVEAPLLCQNFIFFNPTF